MHICFSSRVNLELWLSIYFCWNLSSSVKWFLEHGISRSLNNRPKFIENIAFWKIKNTQLFMSKYPLYWSNLKPYILQPRKDHFNRNEFFYVLVINSFQKEWGSGKKGEWKRYAIKYWGERMKKIGIWNLLCFWIQNVKWMSNDEIKAVEKEWRGCTF